MDKVRFLFDEDMPSNLLEALLRVEPSIDVLCVGDSDAPTSGSLDPVLLDSAFKAGRILVTRDKKTMPVHLAAYFEQQKHTAGVIMLRAFFPLSRIVEDLFMVWFITKPDEWIDRTEIIPYGARM